MLQAIFRTYFIACHEYVHVKNSFNAKFYFQKIKKLRLNEQFCMFY